ncbi:helicase-like protein [Dyadobacter jejuensis]|uniref:Helicase-like protein n=1 Tax=Dyadobacter jejuensis TaxID=1082580 RepID=A0A316AM38_9BACT|nr:DEAD/DEAH box helicase [Dyadobacter jejuensis]PWJ58803.1 helicase-like protein [Dyadobacter jejuensis]
MHVHSLKGVRFENLTTDLIFSQSSELPETASYGFLEIAPQVILTNYASFLVPDGPSNLYHTEIRQDLEGIQLSCNCHHRLGTLCKHQTRTLLILNQKKDYLVFFNEAHRLQQIRQHSQDYGLAEGDNPDEFFYVLYQDGRVQYRPLIDNLIAVNEQTIEHLERQLWQAAPSKPTVDDPSTEELIVVLGKNKYYDHLFIELFRAKRTKAGKLKNPLRTVDPTHLLQLEQDPSLIKFYSALLRFKNQFREKSASSDLLALANICQNPADLDFYIHQTATSDSVNAGNLIRVTLKNPEIGLTLKVHRKGQYYEFGGVIRLDGKTYDLEQVNPQYDYFLRTDKTLQLLNDADYLPIVHYLGNQEKKVLLHTTKFDLFKSRILERLEEKIEIIYAHLVKARQPWSEAATSDTGIKKMIYLSESGHFILITPVIRYGGVEVPILSLKQIHAVDSHGHPYIVRRDEEEEIRFLAALRRQHADFMDQKPRDSFYLSKARFLDENWFLDAFEAWRNQSIKIYGFNTIHQNRLNSHKATVTVTVESGINWFLPDIQVRFGKEKVSLKNLHKAAKNRTRYVALDDGTEGLLPEEWLVRFEKYFSAGTVSGEQLRIPKIRFELMDSLFDAKELKPKVHQELETMRDKLRNFQSIRHVKNPKGLQTSLRNYQKEGLNWLKFLDDFGFGGCLADDMGLGKTVQILAFILNLKETAGQKPHLIVVPTSLVFNWEEEISAFAPELTTWVHHGANRLQPSNKPYPYDIILTTYGTMVSDIHLLSKLSFGYVFLDESQAIKNPDSQRYKAACLLNSKGRVVITGTPFENNSMDLYGQLSFACPGLLGSKLEFKNRYIVPIDRFKTDDPAYRLQKQIHPFILRRTKQQVAPELPDKTETYLYCEMGESQRKVYEAYEKEFFDYLNSKEEGDIKRNRLHVLQGLTKLRQICNAPSLLNDELYYGAESSKIDILLDQIRSKRQKHKILVFSQFVSMLDLIKQKLNQEDIPFEYLTGKSTHREEIVHNFQNNPSISVFLISLKAGGTGLNLTEADYVFLVDPWWNPAVENQAIDRSHRIGQNKKVIAVRLITPHTIEEKMMQLQKSKIDLAADLIRTDRHILKNLSKADLLHLVQP